MNTIKSFGLVGLAIAGLFAAQAYATPTTCPAGFEGSPTCIATTSNPKYNEPTLAELLGPAGTPDSIFSVSNGNGINPYTDQVNPAKYWSINGTGGSENTVMLTLTGNASKLQFGIFDPTNTDNKLMLFDGGTTGYHTSLFGNGTGSFNATYYSGFGGPTGSSKTVTFGDGNLFGYYLTNGTTTFYSDATGRSHVVTYAGDGSNKIAMTNGWFKPGEYLQAWEDGNDFDYNDFVVMVESVHPVPEPAELGMFGLGVLLIGGFVTLRRRSLKA